MRVVVLYHPDSEHAGAIEEYAREFGSLKPGNKMELYSMETPAGDDLARLYGITTYPSIMSLSNDGHLIRLWQGATLPLMSELSAYTSD